MFDVPILLGLVIAGFVTVFSKLREDVPVITEVITRVLPRPVSKAIRCAFCLSYWLALLTVLFVNPFPNWPAYFQISLPGPLASLVLLGAGWFAVGLLANLWRIAYRILWRTMLFLGTFTEAAEHHVHTGDASHDHPDTTPHVH